MCHQTTGRRVTSCCQPLVELSGLCRIGDIGEREFQDLRIPQNETHLMELVLRWTTPLWVRSAGRHWPWFTGSSMTQTMLAKTWVVNCVSFLLWRGDFCYLATHEQLGVAWPTLPHDSALKNLPVWCLHCVQCGCESPSKDKLQQDPPQCLTCSLCTCFHHTGKST
jgi:hypothetical protein